MKSILVEIGANDKKATAFILDSLSICAHDHILSRKLLARVLKTNGSMIAITPDWLDLGQLADYKHGSAAPPGAPPYADGDRPHERLVEFVQDYLRQAVSTVVICENWGWERKHVGMQPWPPPRLVYYQDNEVLHIVTPEITDPKMIEAAIVDRHQWQTGVCSACEQVPAEEIPNEEFFDEIVRKTKFIFVPAFDGSGYLIWSPAKNGD